MQFDNNLTILAVVDFQAIYRYIFRAEKKNSQSGKEHYFQKMVDGKV